MGRAPLILARRPDRRSSGRRAVEALLVRASDVVAATQLRLGVTDTVRGSRLAALDQWLHMLRFVPRPTKGRVVLVGFRTPTWLEWAVHAACQVYRRGYEPILLYSGREVSAICAEYDLDQPADGLPSEFWARTRALAPFALVDVEGFRGGNVAALGPYTEMACNRAPLWVAYDRHLEEGECQEQAAYARELARARKSLAAYAAACEGALRAIAPERAICPSGLVSWTMSFLAAACRLKVPTICVENWVMRPGHMIWNRDRPAIELDVEGWRQAAGPWDATKDEETEQLIRCRERSGGIVGGWLKDLHVVQRAPKKRPLPAALETFLERPGSRFLLGTNVIGDSATLGRATIFRSQRQWIAAVCAFFRDRPDLNLIVRVHPDEALIPRAPSLGEVAREYAAGANNILIVDARAEVNTYALIDRVDVGLVWVSTLGVDMTMNGRPILVAARANYLSLGIGISATSIEDYFQQLASLAAAPSAPPADAIRACKLYQWLVFRRLSLRATSKRYRSRDYRLEPPARNPEQDTFYRILLGELDDKGLPLPPPGRPAQVP
jgi:hypothetical protein